METPTPDPHKLLAHWLEWERGDTPPGRVMSNLKTGGMRELLEALAEQADAQATASTAPTASSASAASASGGA